MKWTGKIHIKGKTLYARMWVLYAVTLLAPMSWCLWEMGHKGWSFFAALIFAALIPLIGFELREE